MEKGIGETKKNGWSRMIRPVCLNIDTMSCPVGFGVLQHDFTPMSKGHLCVAWIPRCILRWGKKGCGGVRCFRCA